MSLTKISLANSVKMQYQYKLKSYIWVFSSLITLQLVAVLFSLGGSGSMGTGNYNISVNINYYTADIVIFFTMLWAFIISMQITSTVYKEQEFMFVMNKTTNNLSDSFFLLTASIVGGITALLSGYLIKVIMYFVFNSKVMLKTDYVSNPKYFLLGAIATILFIFLFSTLGYIVGTIVQLNRMFVVLLPVLFIGFLFLANKYGENNMAFKVFGFFFQESNLLIFILKVAITSGLLFGGALIISNRLEVRQ